MEGEENERREEALASVAPLQPTFKPRDVSQDQLSKFQELHRRRLLIKSKTKNDRKLKGSFFHMKKKKGKCREKILDTKNGAAANFCNSSVYEECSSLSSKNRKVEGDAFLQSDNESVRHSSKKQRQKLHWGLDTKERWEMKANM
ncbi:unnamed protein product [Rhodiola kirilowii]